MKTIFSRDPLRHTVNCRPARTEEGGGGVKGRDKDRRGRESGREKCLTFWDVFLEEWREGGRKSEGKERAMKVEEMTSQKNHCTEGLLMSVYHSS